MLDKITKINIFSILNQTFWWHTKLNIKDSLLHSQRQIWPCGSFIFFNHRGI